MSIPNSRGDDDTWDALDSVHMVDRLARRKSVPHLPATLKIGFKTFKILPWPLAEAFSADRLGECDPANSTIRIADGRSTTDTAETLIHELLHAAWYVAHIEQNDSEERVIASLSSIIAQILRDNPDLLTYLADVYA